MAASMLCRIALVPLLARGVEPEGLSLLQRRASRRAATCPGGVEELEVEPRTAEGVAARTDRIVLATYPMTGSSWLQRLLGSSVRQVYNLPNPACTIYKEEDESLVEAFEDVYCDSDWSAIIARDTWRKGAALFKSYYPAQELLGEEPLEDWQYNVSRGFDKIVLLVRHPVSTVAFNSERWGVAEASAALSCWAAWWRRAMDTVTLENVLVVRFEDLCLYVDREVERVLEFLGSAYAGVTRKHVRKALKQDPSLRCTYSASDLRHHAASNLSASILPNIDDFFWQFDYSNTSVTLRPT